MTIFGEPEEHYIASWYLSALINGDYTSFDYYDESPTSFDWWVKQAQTDRQGHWDASQNDTTNFRTDEVSGLMADCVLVTFWPLKQTE